MTRLGHTFTRQMGTFYYAVHKGRRPGVYLTWDECKRHVLGQKGSVYKKFKSDHEAQHFAITGTLSAAVPVKRKKKPSVAVTEKPATSMVKKRKRTGSPQGSSSPSSKAASSPSSKAVFVPWKATSATLTPLLKTGNPSRMIVKKDAVPAIVKEQGAWYYDIYTDGSGGKNHGNNSAGWGSFAKMVVHQDDTGHSATEDELNCPGKGWNLYGYVTTSRKDVGFVGAEKKTNNTAEVSAILFSLVKLKQLKESGELHCQNAFIHFDSEYAANGIVGINKLHTNVELMQNAQSLLHEVCGFCDVRFIKVKAHSGDEYNDIADRLAAQGLVMSPRQVTEHSELSSLMSFSDRVLRGVGK